MSFDPSDVVPSQSVQSPSQTSETELSLGNQQFLSSPGLDTDRDTWNTTCPIVMMLLADRTEGPRVSEFDELNELVNWRPGVPGVPMDGDVDATAVAMRTGNATTTLAFSHDDGHDGGCGKYESKVGEGDVAAGPAPFDGLSSQGGESAIDPQDAPDDELHDDDDDTMSTSSQSGVSSPSVSRGDGLAHSMECAYCVCLANCSACGRELRVPRSSRSEHPDHQAPGQSK